MGPGRREAAASFPPQPENRQGRKEKSEKSGKQGAMKSLEDKKVRFHEQELEYKKGLKWYILPYSDISGAYMRIEEVRGRLCCGVANFDMHFLMLNTGSGERIKLEVSSKELVKEMLRELQVRNKEIEIGKKNES